MKRDILKLVTDGFYREALSLYSQHHSASLRPHIFTFPPLLKACAKLSSPLQGQILHSHLIRTGFNLNTYSSTALTDMYMKVNFLHDALKVFDEMSDRNLASFNALITGLSCNEYYLESFKVFGQLGVEGFRPNSVTVASMLSGCDNVEGGKQMHCLAFKLGVAMDLYVGTSLVTMYSNCVELVSTMKVFEDMPCRNVVTYNAVLSGLLHNEVPLTVLDVFKDMRASSDGVPNSVTLVCAISAIASLLFLYLGGQIHGLGVKIGLECDTMVGTALVDMYSKCGCWRWAYNVFTELNHNRTLISWNSIISGMMLNKQSENAVKLFEQLKFDGLEPDSATWNLMISGFAQLEEGVEAFKFFKKMQLSGVSPSLKCITSLLPVCSTLSALLCGKEIHGHAIRTDTSSEEFIATALIDMYMKCGCSFWARRIFDQFKVKPAYPVFWNAMISGYGRNGDCESAFEIFDQMQLEKVKPNSVTFVNVLSLCSHTGQVTRGWEAFRMMNEEYGLDPTSEHFGCMVDLLGRSGELNKARELIQEMPEPSNSVYASLLGACRSHLNFELGEEMALKLSELEPGNPTPFVILSNIYGELARWTDVERIRQRINERGLTKLSRLSTVGVT
ncbi:hypothetical protein HS088_TW06G00858 [Tripterygium wilfordii]|uniref:Pentatricopeptide repeat-containing protein n=1 Tax=Tripterygium wilfordii TaxID=458696 RepID=A0A7J7DKT6_TRIWF|nr:pentatricopeptide repeat-containing protein At2g02750 [Tripterygium wilfordii]XP_038704556.1 pentatricopeptide repeat-containing protein At2g02750 [Tripterygium wilfordii]XP_038704557.1 pentatricopeptide repeat-containing protein At2g02750 [Tripterygium wilfordii]XP_038704558.1 pentatricopeptide repeat-containing protein At2g02750 [Tripterygium wilfordii]XP_038704559.1 pentatricopeptide repeat-containing protein At2g02750 [Tripterygium wilfordii]XP_038704560.1 pentatricopeptide repeat-conta